MGKDYLFHLFDRHLHFDRHGGTVNDLSGRISQDMNTKHFAIFCPDKDLAKAGSTFILSNKTAGKGHW